MKAAVVACALLLAAAGSGRAQEDEGATIAGKVVDADGRPVKGVDVAPVWVFEGAGAVPMEGVVTAEDGSFRITVQTWGDPWFLTAMDGSRGRAAFARGGPAAPKEPLLLTLAPSMRVHGTISCKDLGAGTDWTMVYAESGDGKDRLGQCESVEGRFSLVLPAAPWTLNMYGTDLDHRFVQVAAKPGADVDLGAVGLEATVLARHHGKPLPPWTVTEARGAKKDVQLADFRGKWLLVEFWGFW